MNAPHLRFTRVDRITIRGVPRRWTGTSGNGHVFEHLDDPGIHEIFTDAQLSAEGCRQDWAFDPGALSEGKAKARALSGVASFEDVPPRERAGVLWRHELCEAFAKLADAGEAKRTDEGIEAALAALQPELMQRVMDKLPRSPTGREPRCGTPMPSYKVPDARTLRRWSKKLKDAGGSVTALRQGYHRCGDRSDRFEPEIEALLDHHAWEWADESRPPKSVCYGNLEVAIEALNKERADAGIPALTCPSLKAFYKHVKGFDAFEAHAGRYGVAAAMKKFQALGTGLDVTRAGQRIEMDDWEVQLKTLLVKLDVWKTLSPEMRAAIERVRVWICFAIDAASRCILGLNVSRTPNAENACATLQMVLRDKQAYADAVGAQSPWDMACTPEAVVTDAGSSFIADAFKSKVISVLASPHTAVAGRPKLRARIERLLSTVHLRLISRFIGRTFSNIVEKGDYDPDKRAAVAVDMLCEALCLWVVDEYHNTPHRGLGLATPANTWRRLVAEYGVCPPPGPNKLRHVFGIDMPRTTGPHGVLVLGLNYRSEALHAHRRRHGETVVDTKVDPLDLGHVSVRLGDQWHTCPCATRGLAGVSVTEWTAAVADLRRRNLAEAKPTLSIVYDAIRSIQAMAKRGIEDFGLGLTKPSAETLARAEVDIFIGVSMPVSDDDAPDGLVERPDFLAKAIEGTGPLSPTWLAERGIEADPGDARSSTTSPSSPDASARKSPPEPEEPARGPPPEPDQPEHDDEKTTWSFEND